MLQTARLLLRPMRAEDAGDLLRAFADPAVMAAFGGGLFDRAQMDQWVRRNLDHQGQHDFGLFAVIHKDDGVLIGDCGLERMDVAGAPGPHLLAVCGRPRSAHSEIISAAVGCSAPARRLRRLASRP